MGNLLGQLFFTILANDIVDGVVKGTALVFAEDLKVVYYFESIFL